MTRFTPYLAVIALFACNGGNDTTDTGKTSGTDTATLPTGEQSIVDLAVGDPNLSTLVSALTATGLDTTLAGAGPFTVFAPTNDAFDGLGVDLATLSTADLSAILLYHVVAGDVPSTAIPVRTNSVGGPTLFFDTSSGVKVDGANVVQADIQASNGVIHVIDHVLLPPTIVDCVGYAGLTGLAGAVGAADPSVGTLLTSPGPYTVFAPTNDAFDAISAVTATLTTQQLTDVLAYHVYAGAVTSDAVPGKADSLLQNPWGHGVTALFDTSSGVVINGTTHVVDADIIATNGVIHVVDQVLLPPTVVGLASNADSTGLLGAVSAADGDLGTVLSGAGPFTVFAPTNDAFAAIASVAATLTPAELESVLLYHVVGGAAPVLSTDLSNGPVPTLNGATVDVNVDSGVTINGANVVLADVNATNGVVHVIDQVLLPEPSDTHGGA